MRGHPADPAVPHPTRPAVRALPACGEGPQAAARGGVGTGPPYVFSNSELERVF